MNVNKMLLVFLIMLLFPSSAFSLDDDSESLEKLEQTYLISNIANTENFKRKLSNDFLLNALISTEDVGFINYIFGVLDSRGNDVIQVYIDALSASLEKSIDSLDNVHRIDTCVDKLYELVKEGIFIHEEVPILLETLHKGHLLMLSTYKTAETLRIITGLDTGYSEAFVKSYTGSKTDIEIRQAKIAQWEKWWREHEKDKPSAK